LAWPVNRDTWPGIFDRIPAAFAQFVANIARFEPVRILLRHDTKNTDAARQLVDQACEHWAAGYDVQFIDVPVNDSWCRDYGPIFLNRVSEIAADSKQIAIDWDYNAWGGKYPPWDNDVKVASRIAEHCGITTIRPDIILEGGAIEGNGAGTILTTESCLLNPNRNPHLNRRDMEEHLRKFQRADTIVWIPGAGVVGDDTDGHIDQVARFVDERTVAVAAAYDEDAPEAALLRANVTALAEARNSSGQSFRTFALTMPPPKFQEVHRLPASYCNFYIVNGGVVVPTFRDPADDRALQAIQAAFPDREVVGIDALDLVWGLGAFHCMTQQQPRAV
jgi:agmatine deiminase